MFHICAIEGSLFYVQRTFISVLWAANEAISTATYASALKILPPHGLHQS